MPSFDKPDQVRSTPWGKNEYLRSTKNTQFNSAELYSASVPKETVKDGNGVESQIRILQSGEVIAKITSGPGIGKYGPFQLGATDGRADLAGIKGINDTFAPDQPNRRDIEISVLYHGTVTQAWCFIRDATGKRIPMPDNVADAIYGTRTLDITSN